jgi:hypothetical protein
MASKADYDGGMEEMTWEMVENGAGLTLPLSTPATYQFTDEPTLDLEALEDALAEHDFNLWETNYDTREDGVFYCYFTVTTDHYKKVKVKIWSLSEMVRIYPDDEEPDRHEFCRIVNAIEDAFEAELKHTPNRERSPDSRFAVKGEQP